MNCLIPRSLILLSLLAGLVLGCDRANVPPEPIALEQLPAMLDKTFATAKPDAKELAAKVVASLNAKDYAQASAELQQLSGLASLKKNQASVASRGLLTVNQALQDAQAKGDEKAKQTLKTYRISK